MVFNVETSNLVVKEQLDLGSLQIGAGGILDDLVFRNVLVDCADKEEREIRLQISFYIDAALI